MIIHFYLNNEEETLIHSMYDMVSNPFKVGDTINLSVDDIPPSKLRNCSFKVKENLAKKNEDLKSMFDGKEIKLVREGKYVDIENDKFVIEYHCKLVS